MGEKTFYEYVLTHRGGDLKDSFTRFAEGVYEDNAFPKQSTSFEEITRYIEMHGDEDVTVSVFDTLWENYREKYLNS